MSNKSITIKEMLENIDAKISHIEDIVADNRNIIIKLVKQGNQIVSFLKDIEEDSYGVQMDDFSDLDTLFGGTKSKYTLSTREVEMQDLIDTIIEKNEQSKEFEKELKKNKDKLTPGQVGES